MEGNNELALGLTMTIPLMYYVRSICARAWMRHGLVLLMLATALCILGSQSRGALLAIAAMTLFLWRHSEKRLYSGIAIALLAFAMLAFMPHGWDQRMQTIAEYQNDSSAMGRINAWWMAFNLAKDRLPGGGFEVTTPDLFARYAPNPQDIHAAHSIYFQVLGEHGFVGLGLFLLMWFFTWRTASFVRRSAPLVGDMQWASRLAAMVQVALVGYFVGGAFLSLANFEIPYDLMAIVVMLQASVASRLKNPSAVVDPAPAHGNVLARPTR